MADADAIALELVDRDWQAPGATRMGEKAERHTVYAGDGDAGLYHVCGYEYWGWLTYFTVFSSLLQTDG